MAAALNHEERQLNLAGLSVQLRRGGRGAKLLVLHGEFGVPGWLEAHRLLAASFDVIVPSLPGYGGTTRPDWVMGVHDLAAWVSWLTRELELTGPVNVLGFSLGGWVAAELAVVAPQVIERLVLVGAMGIKPEQGEIFDYFLEAGPTGLRRAFHRPEEAAEFARFWGRELSPEETDLIEQHREMTCRVAWKPYMHSLTLRHFLPAIRTPTLLVWGDQDAITPVDCGRIYQRGIRQARLETIPACGHMPEMEQPGRFAEMVGTFLGA
jgi:pimeloyl-ACP methyl ester carboxylesterase